MHLSDHPNFSYASTTDHHRSWHGTHQVFRVIKAKWCARMQCSPLLSLEPPQTVCRSIFEMPIGLPDLLSCAAASLSRRSCWGAAFSAGAEVSSAGESQLGSSSGTTAANETRCFAQKLHQMRQFQCLIARVDTGQHVQLPPVEWRILAGVPVASPSCPVTLEVCSACLVGVKALLRTAMPVAAVSSS